MRLVPEPLTARAFAPFGDMLEAPKTAGREWFDRSLSNARGSSVPCSLSVMLKTEAASLPLTGMTMERHEFSSQSFIPMQGQPWLAVVAPEADEGGPDMNRARAFLVRPDQGVTYAAGTWHHPFALLAAPATYAILMWRDGSAVDEEFVTVPAFEVVAT
jgi:ureidoglycolate lyase